MTENKCVICGKKEFTAEESIYRFVCKSCYESHKAQNTEGD